MGTPPPLGVNGALNEPKLYVSGGHEDTYNNIYIRWYSTDCFIPPLQNVLKKLYILNIF